MNKDQLAALTLTELLDYQKLDPVTDAWATRWLTALADARQEVVELKAVYKNMRKRCGGENCMGWRLDHNVNWVSETLLQEARAEVARLTEERDTTAMQAIELAQATGEEVDQQREDIRRLVVALEEWVDSFDGQKSETHGRMQRPAFLAEMKEKYQKAAMGFAAGWDASTDTALLKACREAFQGVEILCGNEPAAREPTSQTAEALGIVERILARLDERLQGEVKTGVL